MDRFSSLVPEFFYDIIARVIPGVVAVAVVALAIGDASVELSAALLLPLAAIVSYLAGFLLDVGSSILFRVPNRLAFRLLRRITKHPAWDVSVWDVIRSHGEADGAAILLKLVAEQTMLRNLSVLMGLSLLADVSMLEPVPVWQQVGVWFVFVLLYYRAEFKTRTNVLTLFPQTSERS